VNIKLIALSPKFVSYAPVLLGGGEVPSTERQGIGLAFDCPCRRCGGRVYLPFENPIGGSGKVEAFTCWYRTGDNFENITLTPQIIRGNGCGWRGNLLNGVFVEC